MSYLYCLLTIILFSTIEFSGKLIGTDITPLAITASRFLIGSLIIMPFMIYQRYKSKKSKVEPFEKLTFKDILLMSWPGVLNVAVSMYFLQLAVFYGKAFLAGTIVAMNPIFVVIISSFVLGEMVNLSKITGIITGVLGLMLIIYGESSQLSDAPDIVKGFFYSILAALTFGTYTVFSKKYVMKYGNLLFNTVSFMAGAMVLYMTGLLSGISIRIPVDQRTLLIVLYNGIFVTGMAYLLFFKAMQKLDASTASMFFFLKPVIATFLAWQWLGEDINSIHISGIILAGTSLLIILFPSTCLVWLKDRIQGQEK